jgi:hypothetical protein
MDYTEMEKDSTSNVPIVTTDGTFITGTPDVTVTESRYSTKRHRVTENVSDDLLNRHIQEYGLVSPERAKNVLWYFFRKYNHKKLQCRDDNLKLKQYALSTICMTDPTRRWNCTVKMGKDNSPSSLLDYLRIHHLEGMQRMSVTRGCLVLTELEWWVLEDLNSVSFIH